MGTLETDSKMAEKRDESGTTETEETIVVGLVKRVFAVETRLQQPVSMEATETPDLGKMKKRSTPNVSVESKVMKAPRPKNKSMRTMSDFKV